MSEFNEEPGIEEPGVEEPGMEEPGVEEPGIEEPGIEEPGIEEPGIEEPGIEEPGMEEPGIEEPGIEEPGIEEPGVETTPEPEDSVTIYLPTFDLTNDISKVAEVVYQPASTPDFDVALSCTLKLSRAQNIFQMKADGNIDSKSIFAKYDSQFNLLPITYDAYTPITFPEPPIDFVQRLAKEIFGSSSAVDLFSNENSIVASYKSSIEESSYIVNNYPTSSIQYDNNEIVIGNDLDNEFYENIPLNLQTLGGKATLQLIYSLLNVAPERFSNLTDLNEETYIPIPLKIGDKLQIVYIINSNSKQKDVLNNSIKITQKALIEINIIE